MQKALEYLARAWANLPQTKFWELVVATARAETLVKGGEYREGIRLAIDATEQIRVAGTFRFLDRIYGIQQYLDKLTREITQLSTPLREVLDGGEHTEL
jgi:hypothetical protein